MIYSVICRYMYRFCIYFASYANMSDIICKYTLHLQTVLKRLQYVTPPTIIKDILTNKIHVNGEQFVSKPFTFASTSFKQTKETVSDMCAYLRQLTSLPINSLTLNNYIQCALSQPQTSHVRISVLAMLHDKHYSTSNKHIYFLTRFVKQ
jgi:hypothetical protein